MLRFVYFQVYSNWFLAMSPGSTRHQDSEETHEDRQTKRRQIYPGSFQTSRLLFGNSAGGFLFLDKPMPPTLIRALKIGLPVEVFQVVLTPHTIDGSWIATLLSSPINPVSEIFVQQQKKQIRLQKLISALLCSLQIGVTWYVFRDLGQWR